MSAPNVATASVEEAELLDKVIFQFESGLTINPVGQDTKRLTENAFEIVHINEFTLDKIKAEQARYAEDRSIDVLRICPSLHGGALDHPKITSNCIGEVVQKWDFCFDKVKLEAANVILVKVYFYVKTIYSVVEWQCGNLTIFVP